MKNLVDIFKIMILKKKILSKSTILKKKNFFKADFEKNFAHKKSRFDSIYPVKCTNFAFYVQLRKAQV